MEQIPVQKIASECGKALLIINNDMSLGALHDFLLMLKGEFLSRMDKVQKAEDEALEAQKLKEEEARKAQENLPVAEEVKE